MPDTLPLPHAPDAPAAGPATTPPARSTRAPALEPLLVDARHAAALCGISPATWHRLRSAGKIGPAALKLGGRVLWRRAELAAWTEAGCPDRRTWEALQACKNGTGRK